jgi:hypothetical protein
MSIVIRLLLAKSAGSSDRQFDFAEDKVIVRRE